MKKFIACEIRNGKKFVKKVIPTILICLTLIWAFKLIMSETIVVGGDEISSTTISQKMNLVRHSIL